MTVISETTKLSLSPRNFFTVILLVGSFVGMYYTFQADIQEARELPAPAEINLQQMVEIQKELTFIKTEMLEMKETLNRLDDRIYSLKFKKR